MGTMLSRLPLRTGGDQDIILDDHVEPDDDFAYLFDKSIVSDLSDLEGDNELDETHIQGPGSFFNDFVTAPVIINASHFSLSRTGGFHWCHYYRCSHTFCGRLMTIQPQSHRQDKRTNPRRSF